MTLTAASRPNLSEHAYEEMRREILAGRFEPGAPIRQDAVARQLGISKVPLREALGRLEHDGLVVSYARRGYAVEQLSAAEADEIFDLRQRLEPAAAARGAIHATLLDRERACEAAAALEREIAEGGPAAGALNRRFHALLVAPAARPLTMQLIERLHVLAERYVHAHLRPEGRAGSATREHTEILEAWLTGDGVAVERLVDSHVMRTHAELGDELRQQGLNLPKQTTRRQTTIRRQEVAMR